MDLADGIELACRVLITVLEDTQRVLIVPKCFDCLILHVFGRCNIDQDLGCIAHLQIIILKSELDREERLFVELDGDGQIIMLAK